jgi:ABC-type uncharacterized transport system permease subunit
MTKTLLALPAVALYLVAAGLWWRGLRGGARPAARLGIFALVGGALLLHAGLLYGDLFGGPFNLGLSNAASLVAWAVTLLFATAVIFQPVESLSVLILPVSAAAVLIHWLWPGHVQSPPPVSPVQATHIVISLLAYSLLTVAVVQSVVLGLQERALHRRHAGGFLRNLPPLETMEYLLFRMIGVGFLLLTLTLVSGLFFAEQVFGQPLRFTHHIVLSVVAWLVFATLLVGRARYGWRGRMAMRWTLAGFTLLLLGYFGTKFVLEVVLKR